MSENIGVAPATSAMAIGLRTVSFWQNLFRSRDYANVNEHLRPFHGSRILDRARLLYSPAMRYFAAVAEHGAIRAASRELNVASSAVNRQILWLEDSLGVPLFERVGRRLQLSPAGEILLRHVTHVLRDFEQTTSELDALKGLKRGIVRIASVESVATELLSDLARLIRQVLSRHPASHHGYPFRQDCKTCH